MRKVISEVNSTIPMTWLAGRWVVKSYSAAARGHCVGESEVCKMERRWHAATAKSYPAQKYQGRRGRVRGPGCRRGANGNSGGHAGGRGRLQV